MQRAPRNTKWRLDVHAWVILENEESGAQQGMIIKMCMKFEMNWRSGRYLIRTHKKYVQNKWDFVEDQEDFGNVNENNQMAMDAIWMNFSTEAHVKVLLAIKCLFMHQIGHIWYQQKGNFMAIIMRSFLQLLDNLI